MSLFQKADAALAGWPDTALTVALVALAILGVGVALAGPRLAKAALLAWWLLP